MTRWAAFCFVVRFIRRDLLSGELTLLALALGLAAAAITSIAFFSDRVDRALHVQASQLLAADLVVVADQPYSSMIRDEAQQNGLSVAESVTFPSMVLASGNTMLATYKAVSHGYPLRGTVTVRDRHGVTHTGRFAPQAGTVWADTRLLTRLNIRLGDRITLGNIALTLVAEMVNEPDGVMDPYNFIPRLLFNVHDLPATGLIQPGSRARWRMMVAGSAKSLAEFKHGLVPRLARGMRIEDVEESRPEIRSALAHTRYFLGFTSMLVVVLSIAAIVLVVRRYLVRHWHSVAGLRCMGMTSIQIVWLFALVFSALALLSGSAGSVVGLVLQFILGRLASDWVGSSLPLPAWWITALGPLVAFLLLLGIALPPLYALRHISPAAVLRDTIGHAPLGWMAPLCIIMVIVLLSAWQVGSLFVSSALLIGLLGFFILTAAIAFILIWAIRRYSYETRIGWRFGLVNLARRPWLTVLQMTTLATALMALLTLTLVRNDIIMAWQRHLPADTPNTFVINLQQMQREAFQQQFRDDKRPVPELMPMVRGRLVLINGQPVRAADYPNDDRARRLVEREFNLSWHTTLPPGNAIVAGQWWNEKKTKLYGQFSVEQSLAKTLGIKLGDTLTFEAAGIPIEAKVTSLRAVAWDNFRANFFVLAPPGLFDGQVASWITSFKLTPLDHVWLNRLVARFPNITVIDVTQIIDQVRHIIEQLSRAVELLFGLALLVGIVVLWAALFSTRDERLGDASLMRILGASRRQIRVVVISELIWLGALAGLLGALGAIVMGYLAAILLFDLPGTVSWYLLPCGMFVGMSLVTLVGWPVVRWVTRLSPFQVLRTR